MDSPRFENQSDCEDYIKQLEKEIEICRDANAKQLDLSADEINDCILRFVKENPLRPLNSLARGDLAYYIVEARNKKRRESMCKHPIINQIINIWEGKGYVSDSRKEDGLILFDTDWLDADKLEKELQKHLQLKGDSK